MREAPIGNQRSGTSKLGQWPATHPVIPNLRASPQARASKRRAGRWDDEGHESPRRISRARPLVSRRNAPGCTRVRQVASPLLGVPGRQPCPGIARRLEIQTHGPSGEGGHRWLAGWLGLRHSPFGFVKTCLYRIQHFASLAVSTRLWAFGYMPTCQSLSITNEHTLREAWDSSRDDPTLWFLWRGTAAKLSSPTRMPQFPGCSLVDKVIWNIFCKSNDDRRQPGKHACRAGVWKCPQSYDSHQGWQPGLGFHGTTRHIRRRCAASTASAAVVMGVGPEAHEARSALHPAKSITASTCPRDEESSGPFQRSRARGEMEIRTVDLYCWCVY